MLEAARRCAAGETFVAVAADLGVAPSTVSRWAREGWWATAVEREMQRLRREAAQELARTAPVAARAARHALEREAETPGSVAPHEVAQLARLVLSHAAVGPDSDRAARSGAEAARATVDAAIGRLDTLTGIVPEEHLTLVRAALADDGEGPWTDASRERAEAEEPLMHRVRLAVVRARVSRDAMHRELLALRARVRDLEGGASPSPAPPRPPPPPPPPRPPADDGPDDRPPPPSPSPPPRAVRLIRPGDRSPELSGRRSRR